LLTIKSRGQNLANLAAARDTGTNKDAFCTLPLFHMFGLSTVMTALYRVTTISLVDTSVPITGPSLVQAIHIVKPGTIYVVPYALKLIAEAPGGLEALKKLSSVVYGGSSCPQELGDFLVSNNVRLVSYFGSTEVGVPMSTERDMNTDKDWDYMRILPA